LGGKEAKKMDWQVVLGWGSPIGLGFLLLGLGVFLWGLQFHAWQGWFSRRDRGGDE
jgi:hypothetical protein